MRVPDTSDEKFSSKTARRALIVLAKRKRCSARALGDAIGVSKMTSGRVLHLFEKLGIVRKYGYKPMGGKGLKPTEYFLSPGTASAVLDLRAGELDLYYYTLPDLKEHLISPKIASDRPMADKAELLGGECYDRLIKRVGAKKLWSLTVLTDEESHPAEPFPEDPSESLPSDARTDTFFLTSRQVEAEYFKKIKPGASVLYVHAGEYRREALFIKDGAVLFSEDIYERCGPDGREVSIPEIINRLSVTFLPDEAAVFTPYLSSGSKRLISERCPVPTSFYDASFDVRREAVGMTLDMLADGGCESERQVI